MTCIYLGKVVPKEGFRVFIYSPTEREKLVESWDDFEAHMATGLWFATQEDCMELKDPCEISNVDEDIEEEEKKKRGRKKNITE